MPATSELCDVCLRTAAMPWAMSHQLRPIADASAAARFEPAATFHGLRHTWASRGSPLMVVAQALGRADTRMVEKHYGRQAPMPSAVARITSRT